MDIIKSKSKKIFFMIFAIISIIIISITNQVVTAATTTISSVPTINYKLNGKQIYRFSAVNTYNNLYCLSLGAHMPYGTRLNTGGDIYNLSNEQITSLFGTNERYNSFLWVIDNLYLDENVSADLKSEMLINVKEIVKTQNSLPEVDGWFNDIEVSQRENLLYTIQQGVMWEYTNNRTAYNGLDKITSPTYPVPNYYKSIYNALKSAADAKSNYNSPNKNGMQNYFNDLALNSNLAVIDINTNTVGPFKIANYNTMNYDIFTYGVQVNGTTIESDKYTIDKNGVDITIKFKNGYQLSDDVSYSINLNANIKTIDRKSTRLNSSH